MAKTGVVLFLLGLSYVQCYIVLPNNDPCNPVGVIKKSACMVVRPQAIPRPAHLSALLNPAPVLGSCGVKQEAIVRPAFLPPPIQPVAQCNPGCAPPAPVVPSVPTCSGAVGTQAGVPFTENACGGISGVGMVNNANAVIGYGGTIPGSSYANVPVPPVALEGCKPINYAAATCDEVPSQLAPADPVSIALAMKKNHEQCIVGEDKLAYGFTKLPKEIPLMVKKEKFRMPEANLYRLAGTIVELKPVKKVCACQPKKTLEEEALDELESLSEEMVQDVQTGPAQKHLSLQELGYKPAKIESAPFVNIPAAPASVISQAITGLAQSIPVPCKDGFVPGQVQYKTVQKIPRGPLYTHPCNEECDSEEIELPAGASFVYPSSLPVPTNA